MKILRYVLLIGLILALMAGCFAVGVFVGWRYKDINALPFLAGGEWAIGIYTGANPFELTPASGVEQPVLGPDDVTDGPARQLADPFMVYEQGLWYLFFEVVHARTNQGDIAFATSADGLSWSYRRKIIDEPWHLSYPCVFQWQGEYYMTPESNEARAVYLYKATKFPSEWTRVDKILNKTGVDPTFFVYQDTCWLYLGSLSRGGLMLFYANDPLGPWTEHPQSPIIRGDMNTAAPAGRVTEYEGKLYRYAMDCDPDYGNAVRVFEINELNTTGYRETEIPQSPILKGSGEGWNSHRMHHCDPHKLNNGTWMAGVDGWKKVVQFGLKY